MLSIPDKEVARALAAIAWLCGAVAAKRLGYEPLLVGGGAALYLAALERLSPGRYPAIFSSAYRSNLRQGILLLLLSMPVLVWIVSRLGNEVWIAALTMPAALYGAARVTSLDRAGILEFLGPVTVTSLAPLTYLLSASPPSSRSAVLLWSFLGGYCLLSVLLIRAKTTGSRLALWISRLGSVAALGVAMAFFRSGPSAARGLLAFAFVIAVFRIWSYRPDRPVNLTRLESKELTYDALAAVVIDTAILLA